MRQLLEIWCPRPEHLELLLANGLVQPQAESPVTLEGRSNAGRLAAEMVIMGVTCPTIQSMSIEFRETNSMDGRRALLDRWWQFYDRDATSWGARTQYQVRIIMRYLEIAWCIHAAASQPIAGTQTPRERVELTRDHGTDLS